MTDDAARLGEIEFAIRVSGCRHGRKCLRVRYMGETLAIARRLEDLAKHEAAKNHDLLQRADKAEAVAADKAEEAEVERQVAKVRLEERDAALADFHRVKERESRTIAYCGELKRDAEALRAQLKDALEDQRIYRERWRRADEDATDWSKAAEVAEDYIETLDAGVIANYRSYIEARAREKSGGNYCTCKMGCWGIQNWNPACPSRRASR